MQKGGAGIKGSNVNEVVYWGFSGDGREGKGLVRLKEPGSPGGGEGKKRAFEKGKRSQIYFLKKGSLLKKRENDVEASGGILWEWGGIRRKGIFLVIGEKFFRSRLLNRISRDVKRGRTLFP